MAARAGAASVARDHAEPGRKGRPRSTRIERPLTRAHFTKPAIATEAHGGQVATGRNEASQHLRSVALGVEQQPQERALELETHCTATHHEPVDNDGRVAALHNRRSDEPERAEL